ncbi:MAG: hypothetical protein AAF798_05880 [Bacteroidota bacterium]
MNQSRLLKYIEQLSKKERDRFLLFVESPYFNQHEKTTQLLKYILKYIDQINSAKLSKEATYKRLYPKQAYDEQQIHNLMSYLKKLYHRFISILHLEDQDFQEQLFTLEAAYKFHQFDLLKNRSKQLKKSLEKHPYQNSSYYFTNYRMNYLLGYYNTEYEDRSDSVNLQQMMDSLDKYYIAEKLENCCHITANMMMMNTSFDIHFLNELLEYLHNNWERYSSEPSIELYHTILLSLQEEHNPAHYRQLKKILDTRIGQLTPKEGYDLYRFAYNHCIRRINQGDSVYQVELFKLYKQGLKNGLLYKNGLLSEWDFKNITTLGCSLKEFEWTERFLQSNKDNLPAHRRENAYNYNLANLYYNKKLYHDALSVLLLVQFTDVKYHLNTTFLLLRTYYALKDTEALLSLIETFRIYVMRNRKMTTDQKRGYTNFLRFAKKLVLLKHQSTAYSTKTLTEKLQQLHGKIENTENVINRFWLLEECAA